jgi:hypothetical protein
MEQHQMGTTSATVRHERVATLPATLMSIVLGMAAGAIPAGVGATSPGIVPTNLNDTGQTACHDAAGAAIPCIGSGTDGGFGRDAAAVAAVLTKVGAGAAGFDFTKIGNDGSALAANAAIGDNPTDWGCTRDNVTGLTWETKTDSSSSPRYRGNYFAWYSTAGNNGGNTGTTGSFASCNATLGAVTPCNTANYIAAINAAALCTYTDWRLPTIRELQGIMHLGANGHTLDLTYFQDPAFNPSVPFTAFWSATTVAADPSYVWVQRYDNGSPRTWFKNSAFFVYLVRGAQ